MVIIIYKLSEDGLWVKRGMKDLAIYYITWPWQIMSEVGWEIKLNPSWTNCECIKNFKFLMLTDGLVDVNSWSKLIAIVYHHGKINEFQFIVWII